MPSAQSISEIKSKLLNPATTSHFSVTLSGVPVPADYFTANGITFNSLNQDRLQLLCCEATLPGSNLATLELTSDHTGVTERHAYRRVYDDRIDLTFYVDAENYLPILFFESWMKYISAESKTVDETNIGASSVSANFNYRFKYRDEYACDGLKVEKFEKSSLGGVKGKGGASLRYGFVKAYPISISSMPVSYDSSSLLKCTASLTYIRYYLDGTVSGDSSTVPSNISQLTPEQQAALNTASNNLSGSGALSVQLSGFGIGGISNATANSSGNRIRPAVSELRNMQEASRLRQAGFSPGLGQGGRQGPGF